MKRFVLYVAIVGIMLPACRPTGKDGARLELRDKKTGQVIGYKNTKTGALEFTNGAVVQPDLIQKVGSIDAKDLTAYAPPPRRALSPGTSTKSGGTNSGAGACVSSCWSMSEGGASCTGCCEDVGGGFCSCWEHCTDYASTGTR